MRVAYLTTFDARSLRTWSGIAFHVGRSLTEAGVALEYVGPLAERHRLHSIAVARWTELVSGHIYRRDRDPRVARGYARDAERKLAKIDPSVILSLGAIPASFLTWDAPIVIWADATFPCLVDYYPGYHRLAPKTLADGYALERRALERSDLILFASPWAAHSAMSTYGISPERVHVLPFGANIDGPATDEDAERLLAARSRSPCRLLFIGADWRRKGGDRAVEIARALAKRGVPTELTLVGSQPESVGDLPQFVRIEGFIDKRADSGVQRLRDLLGRSHFLLFPTRAECFGVVAAEASAFGVPTLASRTGGVPGAIRDGRNGRLFQVDAPADEYASYIERLHGDYAAYVELARSSLAEARNRLDWSVSARRLVQLIDPLPRKAAGSRRAPRTVT